MANGTENDGGPWGDTRLALKHIIIFLSVIYSFFSATRCFADIPAESYTQESDGVIFFGNDTAQIFYGRTEDKDGYFVVIEEQSPGNWTVKRITGNGNVVRDNTNQEIIYFGRLLASVGPYYSCGIDDRCSIVSSGPDKNHFYCLDQDRKGPDVYTPCNSTLSLRHFHGYGDTYTVDIPKLVAIVRELRLIERIKQFIVNKEEIQDECRQFKTKIKIAPDIMDFTGTIKGTDLVKASIDELCDAKEIRKSSYQVVLSPKDRYAVVEIIPSLYEVKYNTEGYVLRPKVLVRERTFFGVLPNKVFENEDIMVTLRKVVMVSPFTDDFEFAVDIFNKSDTVVKINGVSLRSNGLTLPPFGSDVEIQPQTGRNAMTFRIRQSRSAASKDIQSVIKAIRVTGERSLFDSLTIQLGVEVKYTTRNSQRTFLQDARFRYVSIAAESPPEEKTTFTPAQQREAAPVHDKSKRRMRGQRLSAPFRE